MYRPDAFRTDDPVLCRAVIDAYPFASLITVADGEAFVSRLPMVIQGDAVIGHLARANPQWRHFADRPVLVTFDGPDAYVSPRWYVSTEQVPTWNYVAVEVRGVPEVIDAADVVRHLAARFDPMWEADPPPYEALMPAIVGVRVPLTRVEGKLKLSQNRDKGDARAVRSMLALGSEEERDVAAWMARWLDG